MRKECNIVRDLLPIYADKATTKESNDFVKHHLSWCPSCKKYYKSVTNRTLFARPNIVPPHSQLSHYEEIAKKLKKRTLIRRTIITGAFIGAAVFCIVTYCKNIKRTHDEK